MEYVLRCPVEIHDLSDISSTESVWNYKLSLLSRTKEATMCLDADLVFCHFDWDILDLDRFNAVIDYPLPKWKPGYNAFKKLYPPEDAINAGLWYCPYKPEYLELFAYAAHLKNTPKIQSFRYQFGEQTALNLAIHEMQPELFILPNEYNWHVYNKQPLILPPDVCVAHAIGDSFHIDGVNPNLPAKLQRLQQLLWKNPPKC